ncbi:HAMP domain-containing histidine kinase [candidate division KSB1 bacterium]|nr:HAMP domain-containing histidine kinase [candidate division KSB1 bacterium]
MCEQGIASGTGNAFQVDGLQNEINKLKQHLVLVEKKLAQKDEELQNYLYTVSHELKTPIVAMKGFTSLLLQFHSDAFNDEATTYMDRINHNLHEMERLITDLLEYSKIQIVHENFEAASMHAIIETAIGELRYQISESAATISLDNELPVVRCQANHLVHVFKNLIGNSIKYSRNGIKPEIKIGYNGDEIFHKFYVKDNGVGISAIQRKNLFKLFIRLGNKKGVSGSGLGLAIVKRIIEAHGGEIWAQSQKNKGSIFFFTLPKHHGKMQHGHAKT